MRLEHCFLSAWVGMAGLVPLTTSGAEPPEGEGETRAFVLRPTLSGGMTFGGDAIATYTYWDPYIAEYDDEDFRTADAFYVFGGAQMSWPRRHINLLVQGGFMDASISDYGWNTLGSFSRWPLEVIGAFEWKRFRAGFGVTRHFWPTFEDESGATIEFADATGSVLQADYLFEFWSLNLRYVEIDYESESSVLSGDHVGIGVTFPFGQPR